MLTNRDLIELTEFRRDLHRQRMHVLPGEYNPADCEAETLALAARLIPQIAPHITPR